jgi:transcriptional regulator with XRE-family HTH domain
MPRIHYDLALENEARRGEIGDFIMRARERAGLSQSALAKRLGVHRSTVSRVEMGEIAPRDSIMLDRYVNALDLSNEERRDLFELAGLVVEILPAVPSEAWLDIEFLHFVVADGLTAFYQEGNYHKAGVYFQTLAETIPISNDRDLLQIKGESELILGWVLQSRNELFGSAGALTHLERAEKLARQAGDIIAEQEAIKGQGVTYGDANQYSRATKFYRRVIAADKAIPLNKWSLGTRRDLLIALSEIGDFREIQNLARVGIDGFERMGDDRSVLMFKEALARAWTKAREYEKAGDLLQQCLQDATTVALTALERMVLLKTLTSFHLSMGDKQTGVHFAREAQQWGNRFHLTHQLERVDALTRRYLQAPLDGVV